MILLLIASIFISAVVQCQNYTINSSTSDAPIVTLNENIYVFKDECRLNESCIRFCCDSSSSSSSSEDCENENIFKLKLVPELNRSFYTILKGHPLCSENEEFFEEDEPWNFLAVKK